MPEPSPSLLILGTRGIPAAHGGFETFAEKLALFLTERGWRVGVYCQNDAPGSGKRTETSTWNGIDLIHVSVSTTGAKATLEFDARCVADAAKRDGVCLVLGYNGAVFLPYLRLRGRPILTNMDGIEWKRAKWPLPVQAWFWLNEWIAAWSSHRLVADHPAIADHLATRRPRSATVTIPYGGEPITDAPAGPTRALCLEPNRFMTSIARIEPENNILTMVTAFARRPRGCKLAVLGNLSDDKPYHRAVRAAAGPEIVFPGAIYDADTLRSLRFHARAYLHGHTVGGTNPSLVEALWAGNAVIAHDNPFNRGTAGPDQFYFRDMDACERMIEATLDDDAALAIARKSALRRARERFAWPVILERYEDEIRALGRFGSADPARAAVQGLAS